ncbi:unnamed protein product, partial [Prorocentrum cordatum]
QPAVAKPPRLLERKRRAGECWGLETASAASKASVLKWLQTSVETGVAPGTVAEVERACRREGCKASLTEAARGWIGAVVSGGFPALSVHLVAGASGLDSESVLILAQVGQCRAEVRLPFVIGGDWNCSPEALETWGWPGRAGGMARGARRKMAGLAPRCSARLTVAGAESRGQALARN